MKLIKYNNVVTNLNVHICKNLKKININLLLKSNLLRSFYYINKFIFEAK